MTFVDGSAYIATVVGLDPFAEIRGNSQEKRPTLGIMSIGVTPEVSIEMDIPQRIIDGGEGFLVVDIIRNGPADKVRIRGNISLQILMEQKLSWQAI